MDRKPDRKALKLALLSALDTAREDISTHAGRAREDYHPGTLMRQSIQENKVIWAVGAAVVGFVATRYFFRKPPVVKFERDKKPESVKKRTLAAIIRTGLWSLASAQLMELAKNHLQTLVMERVQQHFQKPPR